jgi:hypothetical protein
MGRAHYVKQGVGQGCVRREAEFQQLQKEESFKGAGSLGTDIMFYVEK